MYDSILFSISSLPFQCFAGYWRSDLPMGYCGWVLVTFDTNCVELTRFESIGAGSLAYDLRDILRLPVLIVDCPIPCWVFTCGRWNAGTVFVVICVDVEVVFLCFSLAEMYWWGRFVCINDRLCVYVSMCMSIWICSRTCVIMWVGMIVLTVRFPWFTDKSAVSGWLIVLENIVECTRK
jgi:hypothetical protein